MSDYVRFEGKIDLSSIKPATHRGAKRGLLLGAYHVLGVSNEIVPHEEGDFERGGVASVADDQLVSAVSYRDTAFPGQAQWLHENLEIRHDEGRQAKFLETSLNGETDTVMQIIATAIKEDLGV